MSNWNRKDDSWFLPIILVILVVITSIFATCTKADSNMSMVIREIDNDPSCQIPENFQPWELLFSNGVLTCNTDGSVTVNVSAISYDPNDDCAVNDRFFWRSSGTWGCGTNSDILHDATTGYIVNEHLNWVNSVGTIHTDNYIEGHTDGANCSAGNYPLGVDANGVVQSCTAVPAGYAPDDDCSTNDRILSRLAGVWGCKDYSNWDTAYGWGDHSVAGYLTSETSHADVLVDGDFASAGLMKTDGAGTYSIITDSSVNWDTAYTHSINNSQAHSDYVLNTGDQIDGNLIIDNTATEALLIRKDADSGDVFVVDTTNRRIGVNYAPSYDLDVSDSGTNNKSVIRAITYNDQTAYNSSFHLTKSHTDTLGTLTTTIDTERLGSFDFYGVDDNNALGWGAYIRVVQDGAVDSGATGRVPTSMVFAVSDGAGALSEVLFIRKTEQVGVNNTSPSATLDVITMAGSSNQESMFKFTVSDAANDYFQLNNGTITDGKFIPSFDSKYTDDGPSFHLRARVADAGGNDTGVGAAPVIVFDARRGNNTAIQNRDIFTIRNLGTRMFDIVASGRAGFNASTPLGQVHIDQSSTTAAIPVIYLVQADVSEEFIHLKTSSDQDMVLLKLSVTGTPKFWWDESEDIFSLNKGLGFLDGVNNGAVFGTGQERKIYSDGTDLIIDPDVVTAGNKVLIGATGDDDLDAATITAATAFLGPNVTSGNDPGHTHSASAGADTTAIHDNVAAEISVITEKASPATGDWLIIEDAADSNNKKRVNWSSLPGVGSGEANTMSSQGTGTSIYYQKSGVDLQLNAIKSENNRLSVALDGATHDIELTVNEANIDHDALTNFLASEHVDWAGAGAGTIHTDNYIEGGAGTDTTAIHDNVASEISAITEKVTPVDADMIIIEDSADSNNKKMVQVGNLPGGADRIWMHVNNSDATLTTSQYLTSYPNIPNADRGVGAVRAGSITGLTVNTYVNTCNATCTLRWHIYKNGASVWYLDIDVTSSDNGTYQKVAGTQATGIDTFVAGDIVAVYYELIGSSSSLNKANATFELTLD